MLFRSTRLALPSGSRIGLFLSTDSSRWKKLRDGAGAEGGGRRMRARGGGFRRIVTSAVVVGVAGVCQRCLGSGSRVEGVVAVKLLVLIPAVGCILIC